MALNPYFTQGTTGEQNLQESLVIEQIKMFGKNVYYVPRTLVKEDTIFTEDTLSEFNEAFQIEAYIEDASGFRGDGDMFSKFGVRISDQCTFIIARKRFTEAVDDNTTLIVEGRPNEGDLIHFPLVGKTFEIQFVEHEVPFFQLGKIHTWGLRCELFEYSDEDIDTGIAEIDAIQTNFAASIKLVMDPGGTGDFQIGEEIVGDLYRAKATATISGDAVDAIALTDAGNHYNQALPPTVTISGGGGNGATATATVNASGLVTGIAITSGGSGYTSAPTVSIDYSPKDNRAEVKSWNNATRALEVVNRTGTFNTGETVKGLTSDALWSPETYNTLNNTNLSDTIDQNFNIESEADDILDFTETNPFGEFGDAD
mgnify:CR=1 FL=1|jgi:hypothetical protein